MKFGAGVVLGLIGLSCCVWAQDLGHAASAERMRRDALRADVRAKQPDSGGRRALYIPPEEYPAVALSHHIEGVVDLTALVDERGSVLDVNILGTAGYRPFREAADRSVREHRQSPILEKGAPVKGWIPIRVYFGLR